MMRSIPLAWLVGFLLATLLLSGCFKSEEVPGSGRCSDGKDNDRDGLIDCADDGCAAHPDCPSTTEDDDSAVGDDDDTSTGDDDDSVLDDDDTV